MYQHDRGSRQFYSHECGAKSVESRARVDGVGEVSRGDGSYGSRDIMYVDSCRDYICSILVVDVAGGGVL